MDYINFEKDRMYTELKGATRPLYGEFNKSAYCIKYINNNQGIKVVINEVIAIEVAKVLGLPTADYTYFKIPEDIPTFSGITIEKDEVVFASKIIDSIPVTSDSLLNRAINKNIMLEILLFDIYLWNFDRSDDANTGYLNFGNIIMSTDYKLYIIDHSHIFDYELYKSWDESDLDYLSNIKTSDLFKKAMSQSIYKRAERNNLFFCNDIESVKINYNNLTYKKVNEIVDMIPFGFNECITTSEKEKLITTLTERAIKMNEIIDEVYNLLKGVE